MSTIGDAMKGIKQILLLQEDVRRLDAAGAVQSQELKKLAGDLIAIDKRVVRIETMIEMRARPVPQPPRIEG